MREDKSIKVKGVWALVAATMFFVVEPVQAQEVSAEDRRQAQIHFDEGASFYIQGEYARAILEFRKGYHRVPEAMFLYNIALAEAKLGQHGRALATTERAAQGLTGRTAVSNQALGQASHTVVTGEARAKAIAEALAQERVEAPVDVEAPKEEEEEEEVVVVEGPQNLEEPPGLEKERAGLSVLGWTGAALTGLGAAALAGSGVVAIRLQSDWEEYAAAAAASNTAEYEAWRAGIVDDQKLGRGLLYAGAGLSAVGAGLIVFDLMGRSDRPEPSPSVRLIPALDSTTFSFQVMGRF